MTRRDRAELLAAAVAIGSLLFLLWAAWWWVPTAAHAEDPSVSAWSSTSRTEGSFADTRRCMSHGEWRRIRMGMTRADVVDVLDGPGRYVPQSGAHTYAVCNTRPGDALLVIRFKADRLYQAFLFDFTEINR